MAKLTGDEKQLLRQLAKPVQRTLRLAWLLSMLSTMVLVLQMWLLAKIFSLLLTLQFGGHLLGNTNGGYASNNSIANNNSTASLNTAEAMANHVNNASSSLSNSLSNTLSNTNTLANSLNTEAVQLASQQLQDNWQMWLIGLTVCFFIRPLLAVAQEKLGLNASTQVRLDLRERLLAAMARLGPTRQRFGSDGSLSSQLIEQTDALDGFISRFLIQKMITVSTPLIILGVVAWQSPIAALLMLLTAPLVPLSMIVIGRKTAAKSAQQFSALSQLSGRFLDWLRGITTLKRLQATSVAAQDLEQSSEDYRHRTMAVLKIAFLNSAVLEFLAALSIAITAIYLGFALLGMLPWDKGNNTVTYLSALFILLLVPEFYAPLRQLGADYHAKAQAEGAVKTLLPILKTTGLHDVSTPTGNSTGNSTDSSLNSKIIANPIHTNQSTDVAHATSADNTLTACLSQSFSITAQNLSLIGEGGRTRLSPISFQIPAGKRIALTGESGSGKSSIIQSIMGFSDYQGELQLKPLLNPNLGDSKPEDEVLYDNDSNHTNLNRTDLNRTKLNSAVTHLNINQLSESQLQTYRSHIGYLSQQVALLPITIAENLRLANPNASDAQLLMALDNVQLGEFIRHLPNGLNTRLGERGQGLSGGQQQRLGIAQLLLQNANLWLLDEPTEHLDPDTAKHIHDVLARVSRGKTVLWVTHNRKQLPWLDGDIHMNAPHQNTALNTTQINPADAVSVIDAEGTP